MGHHNSSTDGGATWVGNHSLMFDNETDNDEDYKFFASGGSNNYLYAIYSDNRNGWNSSDLYLQYSTDNGVNWSQRSLIDNPVSGNTDVEEKPNLIAVGNMLYITYVRNHNLVYRTSSDYGASWSGITTLVGNGLVYGNAVSPMPVDGDGNLHLSWYEWNGASIETYYMKINPYGVIYSPRELVSESDGINNAPVGMVVNSQNLLTGMLQYDGTHSPVYVGRKAVPAKPAAAVRHALLFDGVDDYVQVGLIPQMDFYGFLPYTLEAWVKPRAAVPVELS